MRSLQNPLSPALPALALASLLAVPCPAATDDRSEADDRTRVDNELERTREEVLAVLEGLDDDRADRRPSEDRWSIVEIVEHLVVAETVVRGQIVASLDEPARPEWAPDLVPRIPDDVIMLAITNRSRRFTAPPVVAPKGELAGVRSATEAFSAARSATLDLLRSTEGSTLRSHFARHPVFGWLDGLQYLLFVAGHTDRHLDQMREVLAAEAPKAPSAGGP